MKTRVRFAPSPTGYLHIGGARTALFNWLYARHTGGTFILRIEDTDSSRNTSEATEIILNGLRWLGLDWDEGPLTGSPDGPSKGDYGPYFQSRRKHIYEKYAELLLRKGLAYESEGAIKFKMTREPIAFDDLVVGRVERRLTDKEIEDPDFVIVRSDGSPVFHFANVVDDLEMKITHVIRGEDHLSNTPKHIALFHALEADPPHYAHIPLILNQDGSKMSKRDQGASLSTYMEEGYLPQAVVNYLCLLGWSPKSQNEKIPIQEVIRVFDLPQILRHNARFDMRKLQWLNYEYLRELPDEKFIELARDAFKKAGLPVDSYPEEYVRGAILTCKGKVKVPSELPDYAGFYFKEEIDYDPEAVARLFTSETKKYLERYKSVLKPLPKFEAESLEQALKSVAAEFNVKPAAIVHPVRLACTGRTAGPGLYQLMEVLGKEKVLSRLNKAIAMAG